jgi:hypothetical protein
MLARIRSRLTYANVAASLAIFVALSGGSYAAVTLSPRADGVIHSCYQKRTGALRVVGAGKKCQRGERALTFNQRGPIGAAGQRGPIGAVGPQGPGGPAGANGATGTSGARGPSDAYTASTIKFSMGTETVSLTLPPGDYIVHGRGVAENGGNVNASTVAGIGQCLLTAAADPAGNDQSFATVPVDGAPVGGPPGHAGVALLTNVTAFHLPDGGTVVEECKDGGNTNATNMEYGALKIVAVQVGALH